MVPDAVQVADPFHLVKLANTKLDECRRRVQNETLGHRGRKSDPLYRCRRLFDQSRRAPQRGRPREADGAATAPAIPTATWPPCGKPKKPSESCTRTAIQICSPVGRTTRGRPSRRGLPVEARALGRTLIRWKHQIAAWHKAHVSNGRTEAVNNLIKRVMRAAFGFTSFRTTAYGHCSTPASPTGTCLPHHTPLKPEAPLTSYTKSVGAIIQARSPAGRVRRHAWRAPRSLGCCGRRRSEQSPPNPAFSLGPGKA